MSQSVIKRCGCNNELDATNRDAEARKALAIQHEQQVNLTAEYKTATDQSPFPRRDRFEFTQLTNSYKPYIKFAKRNPIS